MQQQLTDSRRESESLRNELHAVREQLGPRPPVDALVEEQELLRAKVEDQEQTKVESGSRYHVRLSGLALLNAFATRGSVDNLDVPETAQPRAAGDSGGAVGAGVRQSMVNLEVFGPLLGGAKTSAALSADFFGGFPITSDGVTAPLVRLRTATFALEWPKASIVAGQEAPFVSPRSPTSLASTAYPALSAAGNLWTWTPQLHVDHRIAISSASTIVVQWGILDPLTGELPSSEYDRTATAGERSRIPAQAARIGWRRGDHDRAAAIAAGAYHATHDWGFGRRVDAWAAMADWDVPLGAWFALSGEVYRGRAIGGFGGGASDSVLFDGPPANPGSAVQPVDTAGGWAQLKFKPAIRIEFNAAFGEDDPFRTDLSRLPATNAAAVNRNASGFVNAIYQARSSLLFSVEYRRLWTTPPAAATRTADHVSFSTGIVF
jgi:hypothetical protein